jgi:hypothetical protein
MAGSTVSLKGIKGVGGAVGVIVRVVVGISNKSDELGCNAQDREDRDGPDFGLFHVHSDVFLV